jgi:hypothetical protein
LIGKSLLTPILTFSLGKGEVTWLSL